MFNEIKPNFLANTNSREKLRVGIIDAIHKKNLKPGDRIRSINDLSREYKIAKDSVQKVIHSLVNKKILETRGGAGTFVIGTPEENVTNLSGKNVLMLFGVDPEKKYSSNEFLLGALNDFLKYGITHRVMDSSIFERDSRNTRRVLKQIFKESTPDAIMIKWHQPFFLREMCDYPIVVCNHYPLPSYYGNYVQLICSEMERIYLGTKFLIQKGHKSIGLIAHEHKQSLESPSEAFTAVFNDFGLPSKSQHLLTDLDAQDRQSTYEKIQKFLKENNELTAVYFADDVLCTIGLEVINSLGIKIPDDLSIISFSNKGNGPFWREEITRIEIDNYAFGHLCTQKLVKLMQGKIEPGKILVMPPEIIEGETVAKIPKRESRKKVKMRAELLTCQ